MHAYTNKNDKQQKIPRKTAASYIWARQQQASAYKNGESDEHEPIMFK